MSSIYIAMTRISQIRVTMDHEKHVVWVKWGPNTRHKLMIIDISGSLPVKLPIKNLLKKIIIVPNDAP